MIIKKIFFIILIFSSIIYSQSDSKTTLFIPTADGFTKHKIDTKILSFNMITQRLGYNTDQLYAYSDYDKMDDIIFVGFEIFSNNIVFVLKSGSIDKLSKSDVEKYLGDYNWKKEFSAYRIQSTLDDCIKNKSIKVDFIAKIFGIKKYNSNSTLNIPELGYNLRFKNNVLVEYSSSDGLNKWAKEWKENNYSVFVSYKKEAQKYWGSNEEAIINEINIQADAFANTPNAWRNEYIKFHTSPYGNVNFKMLLVAHYNEKVSKQEFLTINYGRYELVDEFNTNDSYKRTTYKVNNTFYTFSENGELINSYSTK